MQPERHIGADHAPLLPRARGLRTLPRAHLLLCGLPVAHTVRRDQGGTDPEAAWWPNPSPHSDACMKNGGVFNCMFPAGAAADGTPDGTPPVLRVKWSPNCSIPYHYHPTGAMYFIQCESRSGEQPAAS